MGKTIRTGDTGSIDVVVSFDTTGSMSSCIAAVRREVKDLTKLLFSQIPDLHLGVIAHGDYCDAGSTYVTKSLDLTEKEAKVCDFIAKTGNTYGGDAPECYELVLSEARKMTWRGGKNKVLVLIGDDEPHPPTYHLNTEKIDWKNEARLLKDMGVHVYAVQCLGRSHSTPFYQKLASLTDGFHLQLEQFRQVGDLICAVCYKQAGDPALEEYYELLDKAGKLTRNLDDVVTTLLGKKGKSKKFKEPDLEAVSPFRFQVLEVDDDTSIKEFVESNGLEFKKGRGFYEWTKKETVQEYKEIILCDSAGNFYTGDAARKRAGIPIGVRVDMKPSSGPYKVFIQSTSYNRKLIGGTSFLYEVNFDR